MLLMASISESLTLEKLIENSYGNWLSLRIIIGLCGTLSILYLPRVNYE